MAQQNKTTLQTNINTQINDNTAGDITAADVRNNLINMTDSLLFNSGSQGITGSLRVTNGLTVGIENVTGSTAIFNTDSFEVEGGLRLGSQPARGSVFINATTMYLNAYDITGFGASTIDARAFDTIEFRSTMYTLIEGYSPGQTGSLRVNGNTTMQNGIIIMTGLPTSEPATSGQLWLSGSAGSNSKILCVRN